MRIADEKAVGAVADQEHERILRKLAQDRLGSDKIAPAVALVRINKLLLRLERKRHVRKGLAEIVGIKDIGIKIVSVHMLCREENAVGITRLLKLKNIDHGDIPNLLNVRLGIVRSFIGIKDIQSVIISLFLRFCGDVTSLFGNVGKFLQNRVVVMDLPRKTAVFRFVIDPPFFAVFVGVDAVGANSSVGQHRKGAPRILRRDQNFFRGINILQHFFVFGRQALFHRRKQIFVHKAFSPFLKKAFFAAFLLFRGCAHIVARNVLLRKAFYGIFTKMQKK